MPTIKQNTEPQKTTRTTHTALIITLAFTTVAGVTTASWQYSENKNYQNKLSASETELAKLQQDPALKAKKESQSIITAVSKLLALPNDEEPTIATVNDLEKLKDQPFFRNAQVGDKVLIYNSNKKAILFRPSENKVVEYTPLGTESEETTGNVAGSATEKPTEIYE